MRRKEWAGERATTHRLDERFRVEARALCERVDVRAGQSLVAQSEQRAREREGQDGPYMKRTSPMALPARWQ